MSQDTRRQALIERFAASRRRDAPKHRDVRYDRQGRFLPEPGNTIICHVDEAAASTAAILEARARLAAMPDAARYAFTAASSLHMTLFQGIIEYRRALPYWPEDVALDTPIEAMTELFSRKLSRFQPRGRFAMVVDAVTPHGLTLVPESPADDRVLRDWRDGFADLLGYRHPDHATYEFHITFAYSIDWLPDERVEAWHEVLEACYTDLRRRAPVVALRAPAFCRFKDMHRFDELLVFA